MRTKIFCNLALTITLGTLSLHAHAQYQEPQDVWSSIHEGWSAPYTEIEDHLNPQKNYIIWSIIAPKIPLDLRKPESFKAMISQSSKENLSISHNLVAWRCDLPNGEFSMGATGMSGETTGQSKEMVMSGWGLTTFLATFSDGWISGGFQTGGIFKARAEKEEVYTLAVEVSGNDCAKMLGFLKKFIFHKRRPYQMFGLSVNPEKFEGAGCISFAEALLKRAGVFTEVFKNSHRQLWASAYRFGGNNLPRPESAYVPKLQWRIDRPKKVSINEFFSDVWNASGPSVKLDLIDPELLVWGFKNLSPNLASRPRIARVKQEDRCGDSGSKPCPLKKVALDSSFDKKSADVAAAARAWKKRITSKGYQFRETSVLNGAPVIIVERR